VIPDQLRPNIGIKRTRAPLLGKRIKKKKKKKKIINTKYMLGPKAWDKSG
jgi:hypothetical protein